MHFGANETTIEEIKEGAFGGAYFRDIYFVLMKSGTESHGKNLISWKILIRSIIAQVIMSWVLINMVLNAEHH